jgi:hypothetical protein
MKKKASGRNSAAPAPAGSEQARPEEGQKKKDPLAPYHTIMLSPAAKGEPRTVPLNMIGSIDGEDITFSRVYLRGVKQYNVPEPALEILRNSIEKSYEFRDKPVGTVSPGEDGVEVLEESFPSYPFAVLETYPEKIKPPVEVKR